MRAHRRDSTSNCPIKIKESVRSRGVRAYQLAPGEHLAVQAILDEAKASGLSLREFAERHGYRIGLLQFWKSQLRLRSVEQGRRLGRSFDRLRALEAARQDGFLPVRIVGRIRRPVDPLLLAGVATLPRNEDRLVLELRDGRRVEVPPSFSMRALKRLLRLLGE